MNEDNKGGSEPQVSWQFHQDNGASQAPASNGPTQDPPVPVPAPHVPANPPQQTVGPTPTPPLAPAPDPSPLVTWRAAEFIVHEKSTGWYAAFMLTAILVTALIFFISRDIFSLVTIVAVFVLLGWMAVRRPRDVGYQIVPEGIVVNDHLHPYSTFKSFGVQDEGGVSSLVFMPLKRFMLPLYAYYPPEDEDKILEALSRHLPFAPTEQSVLERAAHRLKF